MTSPATINGLRLPGLKQFDARFTKGFALGGLNLTGYADVRNILNFTNVIRIFQGNGDIRNAVEYTADSTISANSLRNEANQNNALRRRDRGHQLWPAARVAARHGSTAGGAPSAPNCVYLVRAEQRFGNGDGVYTNAEQTRAFNSYYNSFRNKNFFTDRPRQVRLGLEVNF